MKKIIVAGAGHAGICTGAFLAEKGFDVTVYEKNSRENMGYDWTDIFDPKSLAFAGLDMPDCDKYEYKTDMTFYGPSENTPVLQHVPDDQREIKMERSDIYDHIITHAEKCGVKFVFNCKINAPVMLGDRVAGIDTDKGKFYGDLVIDACGCESVIRAQLPECCGIQKHPVKKEKFFVYRAFYNKGSGKAEDKYKVCLFPEGKLGIGWVADEEEYTDLLIGRFEPLDMTEVERTVEYFRSKNPVLGETVLRGGQLVQIPVRQPLAVLVADGYAAIGDSAFMTVPIIGSGLANSFKASKILADAILADKTQTFSAETLWQYQINFYKELGNELAPLAIVKLLLTRLTPQQINYVLDEGILTSDELTIGADSTGIADMLTPSSDLVKRALMLIKDKALIKEILKAVGSIAKVVAVCTAMPKHYSRRAVTLWASKYNNIFK